MVSKLSQLGKIFIIPIFFTVSSYTVVNIYSYLNIDSNLTKLQNIEAGCNYFISGNERIGYKIREFFPKNKILISENPTNQAMLITILS